MENDRKIFEATEEMIRRLNEHDTNRVLCDVVRRLDEQEARIRRLCDGVSFLMMVVLKVLEETDLLNDIDYPGEGQHVKQSD